MKFDIKYNGCYFIVEAESMVHAVIKIIDAGFNISDYMEFQVSEW